jgi:peroxiredoxin
MATRVDASRLLILWAFALLFTAQAQLPDKVKQGHSHVSEAFDTGPREKPWEMQGTGKINFPITSKNPEVQKWFNQGVANAHNFWWYESERSFRWCWKLEPDNPMAWWGMSLAAERGGNNTADRKRDLIKEAYKRRDKASPREQLWIEAYYALNVPDPLEKDNSPEALQHRFKDKMETLIVHYPEDIEARSFLALSMMGDQRMAVERLLQDVLAKDPDNPGAHHYRIHNWNYHEPEFALDSSRRYGEIAWDTGHALHMPGHIYSTVGMWNEAAISMDAATRSEARYMQDRMIFAFNAWNYPHNKNYLSRIQEQLGMPDAAIDGARQLLASPTSDAKDDYVYIQGIYSLTRTLVKYERWQQILDGKTIPWQSEKPQMKAVRHYIEARAWFAQGNPDNAQAGMDALAKLEKDLPKEGFQSTIYKARQKELRARLMLSRGETIEGLSLMAEAAAEQFSNREPSEIELLYHNDVIWNSLGNLYLDTRSPAMAVMAFKKGLEVTRNDGFALAGLVRAYSALGDTEKARAAMAELLYVWADAEKGVKPLELAVATGIKAQPAPHVPAPERNYVKTSLAKYGPNRWQPYKAPVLDAVDVENKRVTLDEYKGKNVLLVFYLGDECPHCLDQLVQLGKRKKDFEREDTVILAVSKDTPAENKESLKMGEVPFRLLSDEKLQNARRFKSYDDFEEIEIHSTILIDKQGRVDWARSGGDPFTDFDFLIKEIRRINAATSQVAAARP